VTATEALTVTATRSRKGAKTILTVTVIGPNGTDIKTLSGARAVRAEAVSVCDWRNADPYGRLLVSTSADAENACRIAERASVEHTVTYRGGGSSTIKAVPAGWALVQDAVTA